MKKATTFFAATLFTIMTSAMALGQLLVEDFNYTADTRLSVSGSPNWVLISGTDSLRVVSGSLSYTGYASSGLYNMVRLVAQTVSAEDDYRQFSTQAIGTIYGAFLMNVIDTNLIAENSAAKGEYFIGYLPSNSTSGFIGRVMARKGNSGNTFQIGLLVNTTNVSAVWSGDLTPGQTYLIAWSYQIVSGATNDVANLWINPAIGGSEPAPDLTQTSAGTDPIDISRVFMRQGSSAGKSQPSVQIDGIRVGLSWSDVLPAFFVSPSIVAFGNLGVGSNKVDSVTATNAGTVIVNITSVASDNSEFTVAPTSGSIPALGSQKFFITFSPGSAGAKSGNIAFTHDATGSPDTVTVSGTGTVAEFQVEPTNLNFGNVVVGSSATDSVTVSNPGGITLNISDVMSDDANFSVSPTSGIISPLDSAVFYITFNPASPSSKSGSIVFTHNAPSSPDTVSVSGNGVQAGFLVSPASLAYGNVIVGLSKTDSVKVTNTGSDSLDVSSVVSDNTEFTVSGGTKIGPGDSVWFHITFTPVGEGAESGNIVFTHDAPSSPDTVTVSGTGVAPSPPAVSGVVRNTRVPVAGDSTVVTCTITDQLGINSAELIYNVDGVPDTVAMVMTSGTAQNGTYSGTIPGSANADGNRIEYQIQANSTSALSTTTAIAAANSYFAGTSPLSLTGVKAIASNRQILYKDYYARVTGTVNGPNFQTTNTSYFFQDAAGGIDMFYTGAPAQVLNLGDSIVVVGKIDQFAGLTEITPDNPAADVVVIDTGRSLSIIDLTVSQFRGDPETYESRLIRFNGVNKHPSSPAWPVTGSSNMLIYQTSTSDSVIMRIDSDTELDGSPEPTYPTVVTGVAGQFTSSSSVYNDGYQIQPRYLTDFTPFVGVSDQLGLPTVFALEQNYPNPFNPSTEIQYALPKASSVTLKVFNILGQEVATLVNAEQAAGYNTAVWNGRNSLGNTIGSGMYFFRIEARPKDGGDTFVDVKKMLLLK